jgi:hypothetical protein
MVSWGLFERDGSFIQVEGTLDPETVAQLFRNRVLRMLLKEGAIEGVSSGTSSRGPASAGR